MSFLKKKKEDLLNLSEETLAPKFSEVKNTIGKGVKIKGEFYSDEDVFFDGELEGKIEVKKSMVIGKNSKIGGEIKANEIMIGGKVEEKIHAVSRVEIIPSGVLVGDVFSQKIVIAEGAKLSGNVDMNVSVEEDIYKEKEES
ncbi:MAG: polymer-forming cytoskeletal protein [Acidobacteriota bacterium]